MNRGVALDLGFFQIYWYSIMLCIAMLVGVTVIFGEVRRTGRNEDFFTNLIFNTLIVGIIGARLYFCLFHFDYYSKNLLEILEVWNGGLAIHGGLLFGGLYAFLYCRMHKEELLGTLDVCVNGLIIAQAIGRWGNFFNHEAYGMAVSRSTLKGMFLPDFIVDGMYINGLYRMPTFLLESIWNLIGYGIISVLRRGKYLKTGYLLSFYMVWYSAGRLVIEGMRTDSLMLGPIRMAQLVSVVLIIFGIMLFMKRRIGSRLDNLYNSNVPDIKVTKKDASSAPVVPPKRQSDPRFANGNASASSFMSAPVKATKRPTNSLSDQLNSVPIVDSNNQGGVNNNPRPTTQFNPLPTINSGTASPSNPPVVNPAMVGLGNNNQMNSNNVNQVPMNYGVNQNMNQNNNQNVNPNPNQMNNQNPNNYQ